MIKQVIEYVCDYCKKPFDKKEEKIFEYVCPDFAQVTAYGGKNSNVAIQLSNGVVPGIMHFCPTCERKIACFIKFKGELNG